MAKVKLRYPLTGCRFTSAHLITGTIFQIRNLFKEAAEHAPSLVFIDEIDAIASKRADVRHPSFPSFVL